MNDHSEPIVEPIPHEPRCYTVASRSRSRVRLRVELEAYDNNGCCGCEDFEYHFQPDLELGKRSPLTNRYRCWHIVCARNYELNLILEMEKVFT